MKFNLLRLLLLKLKISRNSTCKKSIFTSMFFLLPKNTTDLLWKSFILRFVTIGNVKKKSIDSQVLDTPCFRMGNGKIVKYQDTLFQVFCHLIDSILERPKTTILISIKKTTSINLGKMFLV